MEELKNEETNNEEPEEIKEATATEEPTEVEEIQTAEKSSDSKEETETEEQKKKEKPKRIEKFSEKIKIFEPFLRLIEVIFIGVLSIAVAINANIIAKNQLKSEQMQMQPVFSLDMQLEENSDGDEKTTKKIYIDVIEGRAENIEIDAVTCLEVNYFSRKEHKNKTIPIRLDCFFGNSVISGKNNGRISEMYYYNNYKVLDDISNSFTSLNEEIDILETLAEERNGALHNDRYFFYYMNDYTIVKIAYTDYNGEEQCEYFEVDRLKQYHLEKKKGQEEFNRYSSLKESISIHEISDKYIDSLIKDNEKK